MDKETEVKGIYTYSQFLAYCIAFGYNIDRISGYLSFASSNEDRIRWNDFRKIATKLTRKN